MGWTALMLASYRGHVAVVELLLEYNSDVNLTTDVRNVCVQMCTNQPYHSNLPQDRLMSHDCWYYMKHNKTHHLLAWMDSLAACVPLQQD